MGDEDRDAGVETMEGSARSLSGTSDIDEVAAIAATSRDETDLAPEAFEFLFGIPVVDEVPDEGFKVCGQLEVDLHDVANRR